MIRKPRWEGRECQKLEITTNIRKPEQLGTFKTIRNNKKNRKIQGVPENMLLISYLYVCDLIIKMDLG